MYNRVLTLCLAACPESVIGVFRGVPPPEGFTREIRVVPGLKDAPLNEVDVVVLGPDIPAEGIRLAWLGKRAGAYLALLRREGEIPGEEILALANDLALFPAPEAALAFFAARLMTNFKTSLDLWETRQFLDAVLDASPNLVWLKSKDGVHEKVNSSFCRVVNKSRDNVEGKRHAHIWNVENDDPACELSERLVMESGKIHVSEENIETGGGPRILTTYKAPLRDRDGKMMGTLGIGVDVTRERQYRQKLLDHNATLENIFTTMDCGMLCHSLDGSRVLSVNKAALKLLGYSSQEDLMASGFSTCAPSVLDEDKKKLRDAIGGLKKVGDSVNYEYRVQRRDGSLSYVMGSAKLAIKDGKLICQRFLMDCTAQKMAAEEEARQKVARQKELVRALCEDFRLVCEMDTESGEGEVLRVMKEPDPALAEIFSGKRSPAESLALYVQTRAHPDDREEFAQIATPHALQNELADKNAFFFNYRALVGDEYHYYQFKAARAGEPDGSHRLVFGLQSVDSQTRRELEQKDRLEEALKRARQASAAKSVFLSNMSHDIRTPMNAVIGYASLALTRLDDREHARDYLTKILASGNHLISLINDILDMSYIESGKLRLDEKPCDLVSVLEDLRHIVEPAANAKNQTLNMEWNFRESRVLCDRLRLNQVLLNLVGNAIKYTPEGGEINLRASRERESVANRGLYEFRVSDNGIGMDAEFLTRIFEPFERARSSTVTGIQGTGLGMAITKSITDMMGGEISVSSQPGVGTEFIFRVSLPMAPDFPDAKTDVGAEPGDERKREGTILLVEDNPMNREIAGEFLTDAGYRVHMAENGQEAVNMLSEAEPGAYDIILMDVQMPVLDGYQAAEIIRGLPDKKLANVPIIAMTANSFEEDKREALARGMNDHIAKPIDFKILFKTLDKYLTRKASN